MSKTVIWFGVFIGSSVGGYIPCMFGAEMFSMWGLLGSTVGGAIGVFAGIKVGEMLGV